MGNILFPMILIILGYLINTCEYYYEQSIVILEFVRYSAKDNIHVIKSYIIQ